jgi:hypothetical protein
MKEVWLFSLEKMWIYALKFLIVDNQVSTGCSWQTRVSCERRVEDGVDPTTSWTALWHYVFAKPRLIDETDQAVKVSDASGDLI